MLAPSFSAADFAAGLMRLLPRGRAWPRDADSVLAQVVASQAPSHARFHARANALLIDAFPATALELLPEWELTLGLPDPCAGPDQTIAARRAHVVARLTQVNGPSILSLTAFAAALGFTIAIEEFAPARADLLCADGPVYDPAWAFAWRVDALAVAVGHFAADVSYADEPVDWFSNGVLACELRRLAPAHTDLFFNYGVAGFGPDFSADFQGAG